MLLLVILVMVSFPVFADDMTYGNMLRGMGLVNGDGQGNLNGGPTITRAEMMVLLAELYGMLDEATAFSHESTINDVDHRPKDRGTALLYVMDSNSLANQEDFTLLIAGVMNEDESDTLEAYESALFLAFNNIVTVS